jgi:hypothetical protein
MRLLLTSGDLSLTEPYSLPLHIVSASSGPTTPLPCPMVPLPSFSELAEEPTALMRAYRQIAATARRGGHGQPTAASGSLNLNISDLLAAIYSDLAKSKGKKPTHTRAAASDGRLRPHPASWSPQATNPLPLRLMCFALRPDACGVCVR